MANQWLRLWHDMPTDPKWRTISKASGQRIGDVMAVYVHILVCASNASERGRTQSFNSEDVASALDLETEQVDQIVSAMQGRVLDDDMVRGWEKRQVSREDGSAERAKAWREARKAAVERNSNAGERNSNAGERKRTPDTDTDTDKEDTSPSAAIVSLPTDRQPPCEYQAVVDLYNETLPELPSARLMTEKRKKAIKSFWTWVLTSKKSDGKPRATNSSEALGWIGEYFARARDNDFLMGRTPPTGQHANWRCDLDFLLTDKGKTQVIEKARAAA